MDSLIHWLKNIGKSPTSNIELKRLETLPRDILEYHILPQLSLDEIETLAELSPHINKALTPNFWYARIRHEFPTYTGSIIDPYKTYLELDKTGDHINVYTLDCLHETRIITYGSTVIYPRPDYVLRERRYITFAALLNLLKDLSLEFISVIVVAYDENWQPVGLSRNYDQFIQFNTDPIYGVFIYYPGKIIPVHVFLMDRLPGYFSSLPRYFQNLEAILLDYSNPGTAAEHDFIREQLLIIARHLISPHSFQAQRDLNRINERALSLGLNTFYQAC